MRTTARILLPLALLVAVGGTARADLRYWPNSGLRPVLRLTRSSSLTGTHTIDTNDLKLSSVPHQIFLPDTFLVVKAPDNTWHYSDNYGSSKRSLVSWNSSSTGTWTIIVFAACTFCYGKTDVRFQPPGGAFTTLVNDGEFGGVVMTPSVPIGPTYRVQTTHNLDGAMRSRLFVFSSSWAQRAFADVGSGIDNAAAVDLALQTGDRVVVGTDTWAASGSGALIVDDCLATPDSAPSVVAACGFVGKDDDMDNLSNVLEQAIGTDPTQATGYDSDRDGLNDYFEVIGRNYGLLEEEILRHYGANPLQRDLFVEFDQDTSFFTEFNYDDADSLASVYRNLPELPAAPDGSHMINIHVDCGSASCAAAGTTAGRCGDWGGSQYITLTTAEQGHPEKFLEPGTLTDPSQNLLAAVRRGTYHHGQRYAGCGGGQGNRPGPAFFNCVSATSHGTHDWMKAAHELGHNLGLTHNGANAGSAALANKVGYSSLMNYPYSYVSSPRFSQGQYPALNHRNLNELSYAPLLDKTGLAGVSVCPSSSSCPNASVPADAIDWNHDGRWGTPGASAVSYDVVPPNINVGDKNGAHWPITQGISSVNATTVVGGAGLASYGSSLYAFAVTSAGNLAYAKTTAETGGWSSFTTISQSAWTPSTTGETSAAAFPANPNLILVVHPEAGTGKLGFVVFDASNNSVDSASTLVMPAGTTARQASLASVPGFNYVWVAFAQAVDGNSLSQVYLRRCPSDMACTPWEAAQRFVTIGTTEAIRSVGSPGIAIGPDAYLYLATAEPSGDITTTKRSASVTSGAFPFWTGSPDFNGSIGDWLPGTIAPRLNLFFVPLRDAAGIALADGSRYLAAYFTGLHRDGAGVFHGEWRHASSRGYVDPSGDHFLSETADWRGASPESDGYSRDVASVAVAMRGTRAELVYISDNSGNLKHVPYADGIAPTDNGLHVDFNDAAVIEQNMCGMWTIADCKCENPVNTCAPIQPPTEICEE